MELKDRVVVVTGASSGIGAATARAAARQGARVVLAARRQDRIQQLSSELAGSLAIRTDVTRAEDRRRLIAETVEELGRVDVLVNNAGQGLHVPLLEVLEVDFEAVWRLNVMAPLALIQEVVPHMAGRGEGSIVNISSMVARRTIPGLGAYAATKAALDMLSAVVREELIEQGIAVSTVWPRVTESEFHSSLRAGRIRGGAGRPAPDPPELVAEAVLRAIRSGETEVTVG